MQCAYKVGKKCNGYTRYKRRCGFLAMLFCTERKKLEAVIAEKKRRIEEGRTEVLGMAKRMEEMSEELGIGA